MIAAWRYRQRMSQFVIGDSCLYKTVTIHKGRFNDHKKTGVYSMISNDNFRILSDEEVSRYKFDFCKLCEFYECELVGEYAQFCESCQIQRPQDAVPLSNTENTENMVETTEVWLGDKIVGKCMAFCKSPQIHKSQDYAYAVAEPTSDASFNPHTQRILAAIIRLFQNAIRVYMSATPYDCLKYIIKYEEGFQDVLNSRRAEYKWKYSTMVLYHFKRDYSYLNVMYYSDIRELYKEIVSSVNDKKERWLIFIDDREKCESIKTELEKYGEENKSPLVIESNKANTKNKVEYVFAVNADSKKNQDYISMVKNEKLSKDTYVLITTSVLDNGINLTNIDNIVVSDMEKVKCLQMVGRARVRGADDRKNLYIRRFDCKYVEDRIRDYMRQEDAYYRYGKAYGELPNMFQNRGHDDEKYYDGDEKDRIDAEHWFGRSFDKPAEPYLNEIAKSMLSRNLS